MQFHCFLMTSCFRFSAALVSPAPLPVISSTGFLTVLLLPRCLLSYFQSPSLRWQESHILSLRVPLPYTDSCFYRTNCLCSCHRPLPRHIFRAVCNLFICSFVSLAIPISTGNKSAPAALHMIAALVSPLREIFRYNRSDFLPGLRNSFLHDPIVGTHDNKRFLPQMHLIASCHSRRLNRVLPPAFQGCEGALRTIPPLLTLLHCRCIRRTYFFHCFFQKFSFCLKGLC